MQKINGYFEEKKVLVLGAHPDDELGCGGTLAKMADTKNTTVYHYFFCPCQLSLRDIGLPEDQLLSEVAKSREILNIRSENSGNFDFPVRELETYRQEVLEEMIKLKKRINPDIVLIPNRNDIHQDHTTVCREAIRAFKNTTILGYEMPWNTLRMNHDCLVHLEKCHLNKKIEANKCYESQLHRNYANIEFYQALAKVRGVQAGCEFAECFEVIRLFL